VNLSDVRVGAIIELPEGGRGQIDYVTLRLRQFEVTTERGRHIVPYDQAHVDDLVLVAPPAPDTSPSLDLHAHTFVPLKKVDLPGVGRVTAQLCVECKQVTGSIEIPFEAAGGTDWETAAIEALRRSCGVG
jgi:hypothetical protein